MKNYHHIEYDHDINGRIIKVGKREFNLERAVRNWKIREPDPVYRRFVLSEAKKDCEARGHKYSAQCLGDLLEVL